MPFFKSPNKKPYFTQSYALSINKKIAVLVSFNGIKYLLDFL
ncbi:hypothetical protein BSPLISOX_1317 [uncultured Gammaproteobacteria bacterium]|nr:hypothetical protein [uncultured Gammaproteobacteria bacterium]VVH67170.1 hypothetical protein BSPLISOX_1317 [uncultured Gammaproteobacteria bacterium]